MPKHFVMKKTDHLSGSAMMKNRFAHIIIKWGIAEAVPF